MNSFVSAVVVARRAKGVETMESSRRPMGLRIPRITIAVILLVVITGAAGKTWILQDVPKPPAASSFASVVRQNTEAGMQTCFVCSSPLPAQTPSVLLPTTPPGALSARVWICDQCPDDDGSKETALRRFQEVIIDEPANSEQHRELARQLVLAH